MEERTCLFFFFIASGLIIILGGVLQHFVAKKRKKWYIEILPFVLISVGALLFFDVVFSCFQLVEWKIPSPLEYKDALVMTVSAISPVAIAFFQYRIQRDLNASESNRSEVLRKIETQRHISELRALALRSLKPLSSCSGVAINYNLPEGLNAYLSLEGQGGFLCEIGSSTDEPCFFLPEFEFSGGQVQVSLAVERNGTKGDYQCIPRDSMYITANQLLLDFGEKVLSKFAGGIQDFFLDAATVGFPSNKHTKLHVMIIIDAIDCFLLVGKNPDNSSSPETPSGGQENHLCERSAEIGDSDKALLTGLVPNIKKKKTNPLSNNKPLENGPLDVNYTLEFSLVTAGGYSENGSFHLRCEDYSIKYRKMELGVGNEYH